MGWLFNEENGTASSVPRQRSLEKVTTEGRTTEKKSCKRGKGSAGTDSEVGPAGKGECAGKSASLPPQPGALGPR